MSISQRIIIENVCEAVRLKAYISLFHKITKFFSLPHTPLISATIEEGFFQLIPKNPQIYGFSSFLLHAQWQPKTRRGMLANVFLSSEIGRTHPNSCKTNRVCQKITPPSLKRNFLENLILDDFQLSFPAESALKNHHFQKLKF